MKGVETSVTLELLRHGPAHNQLLSPLTEYLGLCGNFGAASVRVPYEQQDFLLSLKSLRYEQGAGDEAASNRRIEIDKSGVEMAKIFESVPGLISALGSDAHSAGLIHLNLVLSAAELSMLPFELSKVPSGCTGGEGNWLLLQNRLPITLTRQVRSVGSRNAEWPRKPRVLFIEAAPGGMQVPAKPHVRALAKTLEPWVGTDLDDREASGKELSSMLTILERATAEKIQEACAETAYTHVHILAHGMEDRRRPGKPYGLALHDSNDVNEAEVVSGERLASLLCSVRNCTNSEGNRHCSASHPSVVTVASCDSGNVKSAIYSSGASLAHDLHRAGIPLVVASQFPLSKMGSVQIPKTLYPALLWGEDPLCALARLRSRLHALSPEAHDWASLVAYTALPDDFSRQLEDVRYQQSKRAIDAALKPTDALLEKMSVDEAANKDTPSSTGLNREQLVKRLKKAQKAVERMPTAGAYETEGAGMVASTEKRKAQLHFSFARTIKNDKELWGEQMDSSFSCLMKSLGHYRDAYRSNMKESTAEVRRRSVHWVLGQYLSLRAVLGEPFEHAHWSSALLSAKIDLDDAEGEAVVWPHGTLAELHLLLLAYPEKDLPVSHADAAAEVMVQIRALLDRVQADAFAVQSTRRQFLRYINWWGSEDFENLLHGKDRSRPRPWREQTGLLEIANSVVEVLPGKQA